MSTQPTDEPWQEPVVRTPRLTLRQTLDLIGALLLLVGTGLIVTAAYLTDFHLGLAATGVAVCAIGVVVATDRR